jgi:acyl-CoA thioester hydrolase
LTAFLDGEIRDGRHQVQVRVYFEDTDSGQIVYHASFLRFMERGRTITPARNQSARAAPRGAERRARLYLRCTFDEHRFLKPAVLDDVLDVLTFPQEVRGASIALLQECRRADDLLVRARVPWRLSQAEKRSASQRRCGLLWKGIDKSAPHSRLSRPATQ